VVSKFYNLKSLTLSPLFKFVPIPMYNGQFYPFFISKFSVVTIINFT